MIHYMNMNTTVHGMNLFYSTPSIYANTKLDYPYAWPTKGQDDGMPYGDDRHNYWSGYFTSRPALKGYVRETSALFQGVKQVRRLHLIRAHHHDSFIFVNSVYMFLQQSSVHPLLRTPQSSSLEMSEISTSTPNPTPTHT